MEPYNVNITVTVFRESVRWLIVVCPYSC